MITEADVVATFARISNWGRWGADDELGTLNLITPGVRSRAARLVTEGISISCGRLDLEPSVLNTSPAEHRMLSHGEESHEGYGAGTDFIGISYHGPGHTHLDALSHVFFDARMYNGRPSSAVATTGARHGSVSAMEDGIVTRGVFLDVAAARGVPYLRPDEPVTPAELDTASVREGVDLRPGDALVLYVGRLLRREAEGIGAERTADGAVCAAGLGAACLDWLREKDVALLMSDGGNDALPGRIGRATFPIHIGAVTYLGMPLIDNAVLQRLHRHCVATSRWEFLLTVAPLVYPGGTGSPVNPLAVF